MLHVSADVGSGSVQTTGTAVDIGDERREQEVEVVSVRSGGGGRNVEFRSGRQEAREKGRECVPLRTALVSGVWWGP